MDVVQRFSKLGADDAGVITYEMLQEQPLVSGQVFVKDFAASTWQNG